MSSDDITAVLDTNVLLDLFSCHDYEAVAVKRGPDLTGALHPEATYRRARVRETVVLAVHFDRIEAKSLSLHSEAAEQLQRHVPPTAKTSFGTHFTTQMIHFIKDFVLPRWELNILRTPDLLSGNDADKKLLEIAKADDLPLVTNEGYTPAGIEAKKLRKSALELGVRVFTPREFWTGMIDEHEAIDTFLRRASAARPGYVAQHPTPQIVDKSLTWMARYFRHVLLGEAEGSAEPVAVEVVGGRH